LGWREWFLPMRQRFLIDYVVLLSRNEAMGFLRQPVRLALLLCISARVGAYANSVSLNPVADTTITQKSSVPNTDLSVGTNGKSQSSRSLLKFDIAGSIPSNANITSVTLTVLVTQAPPPANAVNSIFDLRAALVSWDEVNATWNNRLASTAWSAPGGATGVDFSSKISQTNLFDDSQTPHTFVSSSNLVADVQNWLQNPGTNFGWVIIGESQGTLYTERTVSSREGTSPPILLVQFTLPAAPPAIMQLPLTNGIFRFSFNADSNRTYAVRYTGNLSGTNWNMLTNFSAAPTPTNFIVSDPLTASNRFYRVQTP
jgi:hypothetical protein